MLQGQLDEFCDGNFNLPDDTDESAHNNAVEIFEAIELVDSASKMERHNKLIQEAIEYSHSGEHSKYNEIMNQVGEDYDYNCSCSSCDYNKFHLNQK